jgi:hypothetical protein
VLEYGLQLPNPNKIQICESDQSVRVTITMPKKSVLAASCLLICSLQSSAHAGDLPLDFRLTLDSLTRDQSQLEGTIGLSLLYRLDNGFYTGGTLYSGAIGNAGGFFAGGYEIGKRFMLGNKLQLDSEIFVGGGGGASQVNGDGLMLRPSLSLTYQLDSFDLMAGIAWIDISGSDISTPAFTLGLQKHFGQEREHGQASPGSDELQLAAVKALYKTVNPEGNTKLDGQALADIQLVGAELELQHTSSLAFFMQASGVVAGDAEGYAEWVLGIRGYHALGPMHLFADLGAGIGGGGAVDTGGGLIANANIGVAIPVGTSLSLEAGIGYNAAPGGDYSGIAPSIKLAKLFGSNQRGSSDSKSPSNWRVGAGITYIADNDDLRKPETESTGAPGLLNVQIDYFTHPRVYLTGQAYTAFTGEAGGYQMGLLGLGYQHPVAGDLAVAGELLLGAGGGALINTGGGALVGAKLELELPITGNVSVSLGAGWLSALKGDGMNGPTVNAGLDFRFATFH